MSVEQPPTAVLEAWPLDRVTLTPITHGHINRTFLVDSSIGRFVLQRVAPIFGAEIHQDIEAVTRRLLERGVPTPTLIPTDDDALFVEHEGIWRLLTFAPGRTHLRVTGPELARSAGELLARFHRALADFDYAFKNTRTGIHDTARHSAALSTSLREHSEHPNHEEVSRLGAELLERWSSLGGFGHLPARAVHGDPKISNVLFDESDRAHCLVDLDTLQRMPLVLELGDALRSWCNSADEDGTGARFEPEIFRAAMAGYLGAAGDSLQPDERAAILDGAETIALELAMRFAADALNESYFGWDRSRFARAAEHNLIRARGQADLARSIREQRAELERILGAL